MKIKVSHKNAGLYVRVKLGREELNPMEMNMLQQGMQGFLRPIAYERKKIEYMGADGISLHQFVTGGVDGYALRCVFVQTMKVTAGIEENGLNLNNLVMDWDNIFFNPNTGELAFLYLPVVNNMEQYNVFILFRHLVYDSILRPGEDMGFLEALNGFLSQMEYYSAEKLRDFLWNMAQDICKRYGVQKPQENKSENRGGWTPSEDRWDDRDRDTMLLNEDDTVMLDHQENEDDGEGGTMLLSRENSKQGSLLRRKTQEKMLVDKARFKIGKARNHVDGYISNTTVVSRIHAMIEKDGDEFYLTDNSSTNGTWLNGRKLEANKPEQLADGDIIVLADEELEFHIE